MFAVSEFLAFPNPYMNVNKGAKLQNQEGMQRR
jgi:hypothetical protein